MITTNRLLPHHPLAELDPEIESLINKEKARQQSHIELIASENFTTPAIMEAQGSILTNKYAEGYPAKRWYGGCEHVDKIEVLAIERAKELFGADHANVQPHSGSQANQAVYFSVLKPGDKILTMRLEDGGHLTHGHPKNFSGELYDVIHYGVSPENGQIDYDELEKVALAEKPKMITTGASAYSKTIDFERMGKIAKSCGAMLLADIAHIAGLVASGEHPSPVPHADFVTTTTHKTLRGPRGGLILCREAFAKGVDASLFPGSQGGPLMHVIAAKATCFKEAMKPEFKEYQSQIRKNARALANKMKELGFFVVSEGTDNHLMLIDLRKSHPEISGKVAQIALDKANITVNKNTIPGETRNPFQTSGIRLGTPAVTSRGMMEDEMEEIALIIKSVLDDPDDELILESAKKRAQSICDQFLLPY